MDEDTESPEIVVDGDEAAPEIRQRKLRAQERRDAELISFCNTMAKQLAHSQSVSDRRDAKYWRELAEHIATTTEDGQPLSDRRSTWTTRKLEFLVRGRVAVDRLVDAEVAQLREAGASWEAIAAAAAMTREGARRKWSR